MNIKKPLTWLPQVLSILITLLLFTFLFEFTPEGYEWSGFLMALIPGLVALVFAVIAWFFPKPGGALYILAGAAYAVLFWSSVQVVSIGILTGLCVVIGVLYFFQKKEKVEPVTEVTPKDVPVKLVEPKQVPEKFQEVTISPTGKTDAPIAEAIETKPTELPPLPPKAKKAKSDDEAKVDYKEPDFFGDTPTAPEKKTEKVVESQLLEPQPPRAETELPPLPAKQEDVAPEPEVPAPSPEVKIKEESQEEPSQTPTLPPLPEVTEEPPVPNEKAEVTEPEVIESAVETEEIIAEETPAEEIPEPQESTTEEPSVEAPPTEDVEPIEPSPVPVTAEIVKEEVEEPTPIPELSILEYPDIDSDDTKEKNSGKEVEEAPEFQLPIKPEKKTVAPWKSADLDAGATVQAKIDDASMAPNLPDVSLTNKGPAPSGDTLARSEKPPIPTTPTKEGVNADFMQWTQKKK